MSSLLIHLFVYWYHQVLNRFCCALRVAVALSCIYIDHTEETKCVVIFIILFLFVSPIPSSANYICSLKKLSTVLWQKRKEESQERNGEKNTLKIKLLVFSGASIASWWACNIYYGCSCLQDITRRQFVGARGFVFFFPTSFFPGDKDDNVYLFVMCSSLGDCSPRLNAIMKRIPQKPTLLSTKMTNVLISYHFVDVVSSLRTLLLSARSFCLRQSHQTCWTPTFASRFVTCVLFVDFLFVCLFFLACTRCTFAIQKDHAPGWGWGGADDSACVSRSLSFLPPSCHARLNRWRKNNSSHIFFQALLLRVRTLLFMWRKKI